MKTISSLLVLVTLIGPLFLNAKDLCSPLNYCQVEKTTWASTGWKIDYVKEFNFDDFCQLDRPTLQVEPELGIQLWILPGNPNKTNTIESNPHVSVDLFSNKATYVIAGGRGPLNGQAISFKHRISGKKSSFVNVSCTKK